MAEQYFARRPRSRRRPRTFEVTIRGRRFRFHTEGGVFSSRGLDRGSELLLRALELGPCDLILDLGCGYGALGTVAAGLAPGGHAILSDINRRAVSLAKRNLRANKITNAEVRHGNLYEPIGGMAFDHIVCNPPIRAGRRIIHRIIDEAPDHLLEGGHLWLVARSKQGADTLAGRMRETFGGVEVVARGSGYKVLRSEKTPAPTNLRIEPRT